MKYVVDQIIDNIVVLEKLDDKSHKEVDIKYLPNDIHEGSVIIETSGYVLDEKSENVRRKLILDKLNKVKKSYKE